MATDFSHASAIGFCNLVTQIARLTDIVDVVAVTSGDGHREKQLIEQYQQYLRTNGIEGEARVKTIAIRDTSIPEGIIAAADEAEADVVVLGIGNYTTKKLGSMSDYVLHHCSRSVMVLKDAVELDPHT